MSLLVAVLLTLAISVFVGVFVIALFIGIEKLIDWRRGT
jgi:hypothetical protein